MLQWNLVTLILSRFIVTYDNDFIRRPDLSLFEFDKSYMNKFDRDSIEDEVLFKPRIT